MKCSLDICHICTTLFNDFKDMQVYEAIIILLIIL